MALRGSPQRSRGGRVWFRRIHAPLCVGSVAGSGIASSTPFATGCGCEPEGTAVRPRRSSIRRLSRSPTRCPDPVPDWGGGKRTTIVKRHIAVDVTGLFLAVVVHRRLDSGPRRRAPAARHTARHLLNDPAGVGRRRLPRTPARLGEKHSALQVDIIRHKPGNTGFHVRPGSLGGRTDLRLAQQLSPLRPRLGGQARTPRSGGSHRYHGDHDQATRPNLTILKHVLSLSFNLGHRVGQLVLVLSGVSPRHEATTA